MSKLARADLNQVQLDRDSFFGRAVAAGLEYEELPPRFMDTLMAYLRIRGMDFAKRRRTGIAIGKEQLRTGIEMGLVCMDLALEEEAAGDLNAAVELLAKGQFEALYDKGWEQAFFRLEAMREEAGALVRRPELAFWPDLRPKVAAWSRLTPETWAGTDDEGGLVPVDVRVDAETLRELAGKVAFLRSMPKRSVSALVKKPEVDFNGVLYRVVLALAIGRAGLVAEREQVFKFRDECFAGGQMNPDLKQMVLQQIGGQLAQTVEDVEIRALLAKEFDEAIALLEKAVAGDYVDQLLLPPEAFDGAEAALAAARADGRDPWLELEE